MYIVRQPEAKSDRMCSLYLKCVLSCMYIVRQRESEERHGQTGRQGSSQRVQEDGEVYRVPCLRRKGATNNAEHVSRPNSAGNQFSKVLHIVVFCRRYTSALTNSAGN
jgi:hypothetical protein